MTATIPVVAVSSAEPGLLRRIEDVWAAGAAALPSPDAGPATGRAPDGTALVVRTSGSTGSPRHVALSRAALEAAVTAGLARLGCATGERWALALPVHHVAGILVLLRARALGTDPVVVTDPGDPAAIAAAEADHVALVPTQLIRCLRDAVDLARFSTVLVGGGPLASEHRELARSRGVRVVETYGATETCGGCVYDGAPLDGVDVDIAADGRIAIGGATLATGYVDDPGATAERFVDGRFLTGDLGGWVDGRLIVDGRTDDVVVSGGVNVPLGPVTERLRTAPGVADAVAVAVGDPEWGVVVRAVVVPSDVVAPPLAALREHVASALPRTHAPRELLVIDGLGRDGLGKVSAARRAELVGRPPTERLE